MSVRYHYEHLKLEALEGRCLPSTVSNLDDSGPGSLRDAIAITPAGGTVDFEPGLTGTITLTTAELGISKNITINGPDAKLIAVSGNMSRRVFKIEAGVEVAISSLAMVAGFHPTFGGGIYNQGTLNIMDSVLSGNQTDGDLGDKGGGIANFGRLVISGSTISRNKSFHGGGIFDLDGEVTITDSRIIGNSARGGCGIVTVLGSVTVERCTFARNIAHGPDGSSGGALENGFGVLAVTDSVFLGNSAGSSNYPGYGGAVSNQGTASISNSTFRGNYTLSPSDLPGHGGAIVNYHDSQISINNATIASNQAGKGGGISNLGIGTVNIRDVIVALNTALGSPDLYGNMNSLGHNLIGDGTGGSGYHATDLVGTSVNPIDPLLGPLADNGGPTITMALLPGSPAIDAGDNTDAPAWDQRGPGFPRIVNGIIDIGAFEVQTSPAPGAGRVALAPPPSSQTLFGNPLRETPSRVSKTMDIQPPSELETEFRGRAFPNRVREREVVRDRIVAESDTLNSLLEDIHFRTMLG